MLNVFGRSDLQMKVYKIAMTERYKWGFHSDKNSVSLLDMISLFSKEKVDIENLPPVKIKMNSNDNRRCISADFLFTNIGNIWMVSEKAKALLEQKYGDLICFFSLDFVDSADFKHCAMFPKEYIEGVDVEKSVLEYAYPEDQEGIYDITGLHNKYVFKDLVRSYPIFRLKKTGFSKFLNKPITQFYSREIFVTDEFVRFVDENSLTGFNFKEEYDDEADDTCEKASPVSPAPVIENKQVIKKTHYTGKYKIPFKHENGIYKLSCIEVPEGDCLTFELNGDCILSGDNDYIVYGIRECNVPKCTEITYLDGKLFSIYINTEKGRLPLYLAFDFSGSGEPETLVQAINECIEACCGDFLNALEKAEKPLGSVAVEYYYDSEQMNINLQDENNRIYNVKTAAEHMVRCICIWAGEQSSDNNRVNHETFERIVNGLHKRLAEEIPKRFEVTDGFELYEPEMID